jgi:ribosomal protein S18 acetylase RimI-like enzyme
MDWSLRAATEEDFGFLLRLHERTMRPYVEITFGPWDTEWQKAYFRQHFHPQRIQIIQIDGQDAGMIEIQERSEEVFIINIEVAPEYQRKGLGSRVIRDILAEAEREGKPVALQVLKANVRARSLYQRLGFGVTGENETHYILAYSRNMGDKT